MLIKSASSKKAFVFRAQKALESFKLTNATRGRIFEVKLASSLERQLLRKMPT